MNQYTHFLSLGVPVIDLEKGVITGVSVITEGEAKTHGFMIDRTTLLQVKQCAEQFRGGLKVKLNHPQKGEKAVLESTVGRLKNMRLDGEQLRADLHLFKSDHNYSKILEMAQTMPEEFGLSVVFSGQHEEKDGEKYLRCKEIYSADLVDDPAANPTGLLSEKDCECGKDDCEKCKAQKLAKEKKESENKQMSQVMINIDKTELCKVLGLDPAKATDAEVQTAYLAKLSQKPTDITELSTKLTEVTTQLAALNKQAEHGVALAKKAEIDNLLTEAARDGKVVPLDNDDLYAAKDGIITIKTEPAMLSKLISKLPKGQIQLSSKRKAPELKDRDGKDITDAAAKRQWCLEHQQEGAVKLTEVFSRMNESN